MATWTAVRNADDPHERIVVLGWHDLKQIAAFIDVPIDQPLLARVVVGSSFQAMATNEKTNFN